MVLPLPCRIYQCLFNSDGFPHSEKGFLRWSLGRKSRQFLQLLRSFHCVLLGWSIGNFPLIAFSSIGLFVVWLNSNNFISPMSFLRAWAVLEVVTLQSGKRVRS